jgi:predicted SAM-dependent methyltransferase
MTMSSNIIVGAGKSFQAGWQSLPQSELDLLNQDDWSKLFAPSSLDAILAEHVFEHLTLREGYLAALNCYHYLKPEGYLRLAVPDGLHPDSRYIEWVRPGNRWNGDDHKVLYTYKSLAALLNQAGFGVQLLEWWDEQGRLNADEWSFADGNIMRSSKHWYASIFLSTVVNAPYTSLVVDAFKGMRNENSIRLGLAEHNLT